MLNAPPVWLTYVVGGLVGILVSGALIIALKPTTPAPPHVGPPVAPPTISTADIPVPEGDDVTSQIPNVFVAYAELSHKGQRPTYFVTLNITRGAALGTALTVDVVSTNVAVQTCLAVKTVGVPGSRIVIYGNEHQIASVAWEPDFTCHIFA